MPKKNASPALYRPHSAARQRAYEAELIASGGAEMALAIANARAAGGPTPARMAALKGIEQALLAAFTEGTDAGAPLIEAHRQWVALMWGRDCPPQAYEGLAQMYESHPGFAARFDAMASGFGPWLASQMRGHAAGLASHSDRSIP